MAYDVIIRDGLWFDGTGAAPLTRTLGIRDGLVAEVSREPLDETGCPEVIDAAGKWVMPGFIDVHTHYDAEVLLDPGCGNRCATASPPCYWATARCPPCTPTPTTLPTCSAGWRPCRANTSAAPWPRVAPGRRPPSTSRPSTRCRSGRTSAPCLVIRTCVPRCWASNGRPTARSGFTGAELAKMTALLDEALEAGMLGMSGMDAAIDKLDGDRFRSRAAVDLRDLARAPQADRRAARARPDAAERTRRREARDGADVLPHQQPDPGAR